MNTNQELLAFIQSSPTAFHAVKTVRELLEQNGYEPLPEGSAWKLNRGGRYYVTRNGSALIAFRVPESDFSGFMIGASHSDSPTFKIKMNPELKAEG
ncbi:MAG: M18 family aminopeptidase, partial [Solobacterium sp.]|nr:M18 family aminopeptidase [Solobacterium sp.]